MRRPEIAWRRVRAAEADPSALADLHAECWKAAYRGILPNDHLDSAVDADRRSHWRRALAGMADGDIIGLAEAGDRLVGFVTARLAPEAGCAAVLESLHVHPDWRGAGIGTRLLQLVAEGLEEDGRQGLYLWLLDGNERARRYYLSLGGAAGDRGYARIAGEDAPQARILWRDLGVLRDACRQRQAQRRS